MGYTIIEHLEAAEPGQKRCIGTYDCAYEAVDAIRAALQGKNKRVWDWYLVDAADTVLFGPTDLAAIVAESDEVQAATRKPSRSKSSRVHGESGFRERASAKPALRKERPAGGLLGDSDLMVDS